MTRLAQVACAGLVSLSVLIGGTACGNCNAGRHSALYAWDGDKWTRLETKYGWTEASNGFGYDPDLKAAIGVGLGDETFKWTGKAWQSLHAKACCGGSNRLLSYDYGAHRMLMFADDVYAWSGSGWDRLPVPGPTTLGPTEVLVGITYDVAAKLFVALGLLGDTLTFDGTKWATTDAPPIFTPLMGGNFGAMVYDPVSAQVMTVGRDQVDSGELHLVMWSGKKWIASASALPSDMTEGSQTTARLAGPFALGYDPLRRAVLFTGSQYLWIWDGTAFAQAPGGPDPGGLAAAVFDDDSGQLLWVQETFVQCAPGS